MLQSCWKDHAIFAINSIVTPGGRGGKPAGLGLMGEAFVSTAYGQVSCFFMAISLPIETAGIGMADSLILMVLALVVFGPRRLPQIGKQIGKLMYEFRKASNDFKFQMEEELRRAEDEDRRKRDEADRQKTLTESQKAAELAQSAAETALNAAAEIKAAQAAQVVGPQADTSTTEAATSLSPSADGGLQVKPPSTGEQVAASRPGRLDVAEDAAPEPAEPNSDLPPMNGEPAHERPATESTAHHG